MMLHSWLNVKLNITNLLSEYMCGNNTLLSEETTRRARERAERADWLRGEQVEAKKTRMLGIKHNSSFSFFVERKIGLVWMKRLG